MARRRKFEDEPDNHDRWLVSYADFITLLFAFFVVMYGVSSVNEHKYQELTSALGTAFSGAPGNSEFRTPPPNTDVGADRMPSKAADSPSLIQSLAISRLRKEKQRQEQENITAIVTNLNQSLGGLTQNGKINISKNARGVRIDIADGLLFTPGSALIKAEAQPAITDISSVLAGNQYTIQVEGHTDNKPISNTQFQSNWELSSLRATSVVKQMIEAGIDAKRLSAIGYSDTQPVAENDSEEGRSRNRRVSIIVLYKKP